VRTDRALIGGLAAAAIDIGWQFTLWPHMGANPWRWPIAIFTCLIQTVVTVYGVILIARWHKRFKIKIWSAIPYGMVAGALVGAVSIGLSIGARSILGMRSGMIVRLREAAFLNDASVFRQFMEGFTAGLAFGAVGGFIPGAIGSLALSILRWFRVKKSTAIAPGNSISADSPL